MTPTAAQQAEIAADLAALHEKPHSSGDFVPVHPAVAGLIAGHEVLPHVQRYADELRRATRVQSIGTYPGHSPSIDRALDQFHRVGDDALANDICDFFLANWKRLGGRYVISRRQIWHRLDPAWRWMGDRGDDTQNHYDHAHTSFELTAAEPAPPPPPPPPPQPQPEAPALFIFDAPSTRGGGIWYTDGATWKRGVPNGEALAPWQQGHVPHLGVIGEAYFDALPVFEDQTDKRSVRAGLSGHEVDSIPGPLAHYAPGPLGCAGGGE